MNTRRRGAQVGNQNARKHKVWRDTILKALDEYEDDDVAKGEALFNIAHRLVRNALAGDHKAIEEIGNRIEGKPDVRVAAEVSVLDRLGDEDRVVALGILEALAASAGDFSGGTETAH